jgi:hypothetical protein
MTPKEEAATRAAIIEKKIDIGITRTAIEQLEVTVGLVEKRTLLKTQYDELQALHQLLTNVV